ncbi:hypothetical protein JRO89_XSUnG0020700 [Xanthoceras sorbifolium]|uniref:BZIP domain-containing protein n=2 Tax=malvids TaxID=91836 RepID=A0ABQ8H083_9ROSI|nr:hypothetical protein JRO89_XSUnG0020700 [Xanthoceras sorbifolium]
MEDLEFPENGIEWNDLFTEVFDSSAAAETFSNPSPDDSVSNWVAEIESMLFNDDGVDLEPSQPLLDNFFSDILVDSPIICDDLESNQHLLENFFSDVPVDAAATDKSTNVSDECAPVSSEEEKVSDGPEVNNDNDNDNDEKNYSNDDDENDINNDADANDPISKKRKRQLRNRDAAVRSRERKKMYVKDLEMKSRYLEGECRRLGRLLQCVLAENQSLHYSLQKGNALGASSAKQESAVLLLGMHYKSSSARFHFIISYCLSSWKRNIISKLEYCPHCMLVLLSSGTILWAEWGQLGSQALAVPRSHEHSLLDSLHSGVYLAVIIESLLLGSLLWFLGIMCLFTLPPPTLSNLESVPLVHVEDKAPGDLGQRGAGSNHFTLSGLKSRRCKASRTKMKLIYHVIRV